MVFVLRWGGGEGSGGRQEFPLFGTLEEAVLLLLACSSLDWGFPRG